MWTLFFLNNMEEPLLGDMEVPYFDTDEPDPSLGPKDYVIKCTNGSIPVHKEIVKERSVLLMELLDIDPDSRCCTRLIYPTDLMIEAVRVMYGKKVKLQDYHMPKVAHILHEMRVSYAAHFEESRIPGPTIPPEIVGKSPGTPNSLFLDLMGDPFLPKPKQFEVSPGEVQPLITPDKEKDDDEDDVKDDSESSAGPSSSAV